MTLLKLRKKLLHTEHLRRNEILNGKSTQGTVTKPGKRNTGHRDPQRPQGQGQREEWVSLTHRLHKLLQEDSSGDMLAMQPQEQVNFGIFSSTFQTLIGIQIQHLAKIQTLI